MLQREIDPEIRADIEKFEEQLARYLAGRPRGGRLPRLPPEQRHLRPAPGRPQPDGAGEGAVRLHHARAARHVRPHRRDLQPRLGPPHHPAEHAVPLRRPRADPRRAARHGVGRPHLPRGVRRHRPQRHGLPPRRRLPVRGARHQPVGRGRLPALPPPPARPAPAPQVQDQLLRLRDRLRPGDVQRRRRDRHHPHPRRRHPRGRLPRVRRRRPRRQPAPGARPRGVHGARGPAWPRSRRSSGCSRTTATATTSSGPA